MSDEFTVESILGPGGVLATELPGYEHRPQQLRMAQAVARAFRERSYLLAEAGTGTGKTLAYLLPAILSGRRVVISTATKTLQEQIFFKDLPLLRERVGLGFEASYLKGRSNYLCVRKLETFAAEPRFEDRQEAARWPALFDWARSTQTGDRSEVDLPEHFAAWRELSTTAEACLGPRCPEHDRCFVTRLRRQAERSQLLVVNHHLFFADLVVRERAGGEGILPRYEAVIFDEAHGLEEAATSFFGCAVSSFRFDELLHDAERALPAGDERAGLLSALTLKVRGEADAFLREVPQAVGGLRPGGVVRLERRRLEPLGYQVEAVLHSLAALGSFCAGAEEPEVLAIGRRGQELAADLQFVAGVDSVDHVYWAEGRGRGVFLKAAPIDVAESLRETLYGKVDTLVFTSATLRAEARFDFFARRIGLDPPMESQQVAEVAVDSPFDYARQAALYLPTHLPEPNAPEFSREVAEEILSLAEITGGRAFALFTSFRNMEAVHALAKDRLGCQVLLQGERPKRALLEAFQAEPSVLFATHSFWEGVDVPGEALSLVVIDKLPFASPGDPLVAARIEQLRQRGQEPFYAYQLPEAAIALRQGFGRLIRTRQDRGIVAVLDRRLSTRSYGRAFLRSLPPARRFREKRLLAEWFERG